MCRLQAQPQGYVRKEIGVKVLTMKKLTQEEINESLAKCEEALKSHDAVLFQDIDIVNHPNWYTDSNIEVIDYIEDKGFGFHLGNAIKYISRAGKKDPTKTVEDLRKAEWYIERYIELKEREDD